MTESVAERQCDVCQAVVPAEPLDQESKNDPYSLAEHKCREHGTPGWTQCARCDDILPAGALVSHLSFDHNLPPPTDAERAQHNADLIRHELAGLDHTIIDASEKATDKLDALLKELRGLRGQRADPWQFFWPIVVAVITAQLLAPIVRDLVVAVLGALARLGRG